MVMNKTNFTPEIIQKLVERAKKGAIFLFLPNSKLKEAVLYDTEPLLKKVPQSIKTKIISENTLPISSDLLVCYVSGATDPTNTFILDNGEIRVHDDVGFKIKIDK